MADYTIPDGTTTVDGNDNYSHVVPGDRLLIPSTRTTYIVFKHLEGTAANPITITNSGGKVSIDSSARWCALLLEECEHIHLTGTGHASHTYGFDLYNATNCGISTNTEDGSRYLEIDYIEIRDSDSAGIRSGQSANLTRTEWTCYDLHIHHNYIHDCATEGMYVGSSDWAVGTDVEIEGLEISYNTVTDCLYDGIQIGSATTDVSVHHNTIEDIGIGEEPGGGQTISGIVVNQGTTGDYYNNWILRTDRLGILFNGAGGYDVYNNVIAHIGEGDAGDNGMRWYGGAGDFYNNTIVDVDGDGINASAGCSGDIYDNIVVGITGTDIDEGGASKTNNTTGTIASAKFVDSANDDYHLKPESPARDAGSASGYAAMDYDGIARPQGGGADIGAFEFLSGGEESGGTLVGVVIREAATVDVAPYTQDFTTSDLGGRTPRAAIFKVSLATSDGTATADANLCIGTATATDEEWAAAFTDEDGQGTTDSASVNINDGCILILDPGDATIDGEANLDSFIENGVRVNWTNAPSAAYLITVTLLAGSDLSAQALTISLGDAVDNAVNVTTVGFQPSDVLSVLQDPLADTGTGDGVNFSMGAVHFGADIVQRAYTITSQHGQAAAALAARFTQSYGAMSITSAGALDYGVEFSDPDTDGFTVTTRNAGGNNADLLCLALSFWGIADSWVGTLPTPTSTGTDTQPPPGFEPQTVLQLVTHAEAIDTAYADGNAGAFCLSVFDSTREYSNSVAMEDGADPTNTQCLSDDRAVNLDEHDGTDGHEASFVSFGSWTLDWTTTMSASKLIWAFALGATAPAAEAVVPSALGVSDLRRHMLFLTSDKGLRLHDGDGHSPLATFLEFRASRVANGIGWIDVIVPPSFDTDLFWREDFMIQFWRAPKGGKLALWRPYFLRAWGSETRGGDERVFLSGPCVNDLLRRRDIIAFAGSAEADKTDYADDMMKALVIESMSDSVEPTPDAGTRVWSLLSVAADLSLGPTISKGMAFKGPLLSDNGGGVLPEIAAASRIAGTDLFFDIVTSSVTAASISLEFRTYTGQRGQDLSSIIVFDEARGNMGDCHYWRDASREVNYVYGAGQGDGSARNVQQVYDADRYGKSAWNRCEAVADARNESPDNAVREKARDLLKAGEPLEEAGGVLKDTRETRYGIHWDFGDKITARYRNKEFISMIAAVEVFVNKAGERVTARWDYSSDV